MAHKLPLLVVLYRLAAWASRPHLFADTMSALFNGYLPIVKIAPQYPRRALSRGLEGYVIVEYTVTKQGTVKNAVVVESKPEGIFDSAAVKSALRYKYKPRVVDGEPIEVSGVRTQINFELDE